MTENITDSHVVRRLERSSSDRMLAGVCGGLGRYFELNPMLARKYDQVCRWPPYT